MNLFLYVEKTSWLHRADPRSKIFAMLGVFFLALGVNGMLPVLILAISVVLAGFSAGFGPNLKRLSGLLSILLAATTVLWGLTTGVETFWFFFKSDGLQQGFAMGIKMVIMVTAGLIWLSTTKIEEMTAGMERLGIPYHIAFTFSTAVRLVPWIVAGCVTVSEAQQSRGLNPDSGSLLQRLRNFIPLMIPALVVVVRNANCFSMALESRGFGRTVARTSFLQIGLGLSDVLLAIAMAILMAVCLWFTSDPIQGLLWNGAVLLAFFFGFILVLRVSARQESGRLLWLNTRMVVLAALSAALYAAVVIPFKGIVLVPGISDFRPGMALPPVLGLLFGPSAAWGSGFGCVISDFFGSLGPGSFFGFLGNFAMAWIPYRLWWKTGLVRVDDPEPMRIDSFGKGANFIILSILGALTCAFVISWGVDLLGIVPFKVLTVIIALNNSAPVIILSLPILMVLYPRIKKWGLLWTDILGPVGTSVFIQRTWVGAFVTLLGIAVGFGGGLFVSIMLGLNPLPVAGVGLLLLVAGSFL